MATLKEQQVCSTLHLALPADAVNSNGVFLANLILSSPDHDVPSRPTLQQAAHVWQCSIPCVAHVWCALHLCHPVSDLVQMGISSA